MTYGELPTSPVVFAACDSRYFIEHAGSFVYSAAEHGFDVHIHVVNPSDQVLSYAAILASTVQVRVTFTFNDAEIGTWHPDERRAYYACLRFNVAPVILQHAGKILILDIDCLVKNKFEFPELPVGYYPREPLPGTVGWEAEGTKVAAGAVYFSKEAMNVCNAVAETISGLPLRWFNDQIALSHVFAQLPEEVCHKFDSKFMDWEFIEGTSIWTGKGPRKHDNPTYVAEKKKYDLAPSFIESAENVVLAPRLDLMFKRNGVDVAKNTIEPIREHWKNFADKLAKENNSLTITAPKWFFNKTIADDYFPKATVYVPHMEKSWWGGGDNCRYYMQTVFPWLFTVDAIGWAGGSEYKRYFDPKFDYDNGEAFNTLNEYVKKGGTKFKSIQGTRKWERKESYILVPLQLPHDETIKYHSEVDVFTLVKQLCEWADNGGMHVVFKGHPINLGAMQPLMNIIEQYDNVEYVTDYPINDMIEQACAVYVVNSGTGQESMLYDRSVVIFGRCDYEGAVLKGDINDLAGTWTNVLEDDFHERKAIYRRWFGWFINEATINSKP